MLDYDKNKILDLSKLKAFADNKINVANKMIYVFDRAIPPFPTVFSKGLILRGVKS